MKKYLSLFLCLALALTLAVTFASCTGDEDVGTESQSVSESVSDSDDGSESVSESESTSESESITDTDTTADSESTSDSESESETLPPIEGDVYIGTAEELMAFNKSINEDYAELYDATVVFTADIDMEGYTWTPLITDCMDAVIFEGQGHTISNLTFVDYAPPTGTQPSEMGSGFIGVNKANLSFRNLTFENAKVTAYERAVGCIIGVNVNGSAYVDFENVHVKGFKADGWMDYTNDHFEEQHPISFRLGGFVGHNMGGFFTFVDCSATELTLSGFHNLAGFVGYDGTGNVDEYSFEGCKVEDCKFTFSYCLSDSYTADMPRKFVSVFYNGIDWIDHIDDVVEMDNEYANVFYYDWTDDNAEYDADEFRSWTQEEKESIEAAG